MRRVGRAVWFGEDWAALVSGGARPRVGEVFWLGLAVAGGVAPLGSLTPERPLKLGRQTRRSGATGVSATGRPWYARGMSPFDPHSAVTCNGERRPLRGTGGLAAAEGTTAADGRRRNSPMHRGGFHADLRRRAVDDRRCGRNLYRTSIPLCRRSPLRVGDDAGGGLVMARLERLASVETPTSAPHYRLRVRRHGPDQDGVRGVARAQAARPRRDKLGSAAAARTHCYALTEDLGLTLGLLLLRRFAPTPSRVPTVLQLLTDHRPRSRERRS